MEKSRMFKPKFIQTEILNKRYPTSLVERQKNILMRAQMHKPANKAQLGGMQETRHKEWFLRTNSEDKHHRSMPN